MHACSLPRPMAWMNSFRAASFRVGRQRNWAQSIVSEETNTYRLKLWHQALVYWPVVRKQLRSVTLTFRGVRACWGHPDTLPTHASSKQDRSTSSKPASPSGFGSAWWTDRHSRFWGYRKPANYSGGVTRESRTSRHLLLTTRGRF